MSDMTREEWETWQDDRLAEIRAGRLRRAGIPRRWLAETWNGIESGADRLPALGAARRWATGQGPRGVLLYGGVGRGKSHIAAVAAVERTGISAVKWLNVAELLLALNLPFGDPARKEAVDSLEPVGDAALVLDDFDKLRPTEAAIQPLYVAVNAWVEEEQPLLVTMNSSLNQLAADLGRRYGDAIGSRLGGYCEVHEVGGADRRLI